MPEPMHDTLVLPTQLTAIDDARRWTSDHAHGAQFDPTAIAEVEVAMTEALSNVIVHSYDEQPGEQLLLSLDIDDDRLALGIRDRGRPFDPAQYRAPDLDEPAEGGYGVHLIEALMDEVTRRPLADGGTLVLLVRYRSNDGRDRS
ncbi:MAG: putative anti-sigma regulatory factor, serine/threonine protein kinase [Conexibacter sp.]|jgi:serine/threonine-protein kinase RsbW|nr:putative anti-sigma regulatory factor, serine/threonine protein kinase [Conexibacter sp.]